MPIACRLKAAHGPQFCATDCPASAPCGAFSYVRVESQEQLPPYDPRSVDVAVLDMNHGWPNLGHDSLVHTVLDASCDLMQTLHDLDLRVRVLSFEVRRKHMLPEAPDGRFGLYLGTGGPGHLDPRFNRDQQVGSQDLDEDPAWEEPLFALFDAISAHPDAALLAVCHTFGVMCRWAGVAEPRLREKDGKSVGIRENTLTEAGRAHPWFQRLAEALPDGRRLRIVDSRLFDLVPREEDLVEDRHGRLAIGYEWPRWPHENALTMMEFARDPGGVMPRVFGVNHHPEIVDRARQLVVLEHKRRAEGERLPARWYEERIDLLTSKFADEDTEQRLQLTSDYTLLGPLRFHLVRQVRRRAEALGLPFGLHEDDLLA